MVCAARRAGHVRRCCLIGRRSHRPAAAASLRSVAAVISHRTTSNGQPPSWPNEPLP